MDLALRSWQGANIIVCMYRAVTKIIGLATAVPSSASSCSRQDTQTAEQPRGMRSKHVYHFVSPKCTYRWVGAWLSIEDRLADA